MKIIDVGLMANHIPAHKGIISRLELYSQSVSNGQLLTIFQKQIGMMKNHVQVMNQLLNPNQQLQVAVPPIPNNSTGYYNQPKGNIGIEEKDMLFDAHFTAVSMANENFMSASNMKAPLVKRAHIEMGLQQNDIANQFEMLAEQLGWSTNHPNATVMEQNQVMSPIPNPQAYMNMQNQFNTQNIQNKH
ncbi:hypothetical protein [Litchfieldia salsa]|uniref:Uncharacterized protein n=1 Tax=Litchfieldia salsa TaxID=930152 RepID=A0A1H0QBW6_9BACI|nr:hypothetical protein [Litchfieldia salsa]SDP14565.1 hypothetical protein SAMN05216565_101683 [Litchfieldia salsa]